ncbi:hypothetical protein [Trueperella sp. LYQ141]|uniref:hypothetical protein n=1 Tax=Trueperella sp. LYQ141 TaxID=3391058 RepID=UPI003982F4C0
MRFCLRGRIAASLAALCALAACSSSPEGSSSSPESENGASETTSSLQSAFTHIDLDLNATYDFPKPFAEATTFGSPLRASLQGFWFFYYSNIDIAVEHSLTGKKDLKTLPVDLVKERKDPSLAWFYDGVDEDKEPALEIANTEDVTVGDYDTVYFESTPQSIENFLGDKYSRTIIGYNFMFDGKAVSVSSTWIDPASITDESQKEGIPGKDDVKAALRHVVLTMKPYDGKSSFADLKSNLRDVIDDGKTVSADKWGSKVLGVNMPSNHTINFGLGNELRHEESFFVIGPDKGDYNGDPATIIDLIFNPKMITGVLGETVPALSEDLLFVNWDKNEAGQWELRSNYDRKDLGKVTVNGHDFNTYLIQQQYKQQSISGNSYYMATADIDGVPVVYVFQPTVGRWSEDMGDPFKLRDDMAGTVERLGKTWLLSVNMYDSEDAAYDHVSFF